MQKDFNIIKKGIKNCSRIPYQFDSNDFCVRERTCFQIELKSVGIWPFVITKNLDVNKIICPCSGKHSYVCEIKYCSVNKEACDSIKFKKNSKLHYSKKCDNDLTLY